MKSILFSGWWFFAVATLFGQNPASPVITIRKGTAVRVQVKDFAGPGGAGATAVLRNDIQLSGALALGDPANATVVISGTANPGSLAAEAIDRTGGIVLQKSYGGDTRRAVHKFADDLVETLTGLKGIATSRIAFVSNRTGHKEIYVADYDGANAFQLTRDNAISVSPHLSADGRRLTYTGYQSGYADVYLIELASGARNRVLKFPGTNTGAAISPDGTRIACTLSKDGSPAIYITSINGDSPRRLTRSRGIESSPTWSPGGGEIIYSSDQTGAPQLYQVSAGGGIGRLLNTGFGYCTEPNWSPDGKRVAFNVRGGGAFQVAVLELDAGSARVVAGDGQNPVWGPDSRHLLFARSSGLYMLDTLGNRETRIVGDLGRTSEPAWSH
jgi:TolB protein